MTPFSIDTLLTKKDYTIYLYRHTYKRPYTVIITIIGLFLVLLSTLDFMSVINVYEEKPFLELGIGLFLLLSPTISILIARNSYYSNPSLRHNITYTFGEDEIKIKGLTFESAMQWNHIVKLKEFNNYLLLYSSKKIASFVKKNNMTKAQIEFIKSKVGKK